MRKSQIGILAVAAVATLAFTGCGSGATTGGGAGDNSIVIDMWSGSEDDTTALNEQLAIAKAENPDLDITLRTAPWGDYFTKMTTNMASGNMACISGMNSGMLSGYTAGFAALTADDLKAAGLNEADFAPGALEILKNKGEMYGVPFDMSTMLVYYNADQLKAAAADTPKIGWTFGDFEKTAKAATKDGKQGFGVGMGDFQWQALPISMAGAQPVTEDGTLDLTNPDFLKASEWYGELVTKAKVAAPVASASDTGWGENQYSSGNAAMAVDGTWNAVGYLNNDPGFEAGMAPLPAGDKGSLGLVLGSGYGLSKECKNKDAALKVLGSLLGEKSQDYIATSGRSYPARLASQPLYFETIDAKYRDQVKSVFEAAFENVEGQRVSDQWSKVGTYIQPNLVSVYNGQESMAKVLESAQQQFAK
ncbi:carbohydrate ABC transporter substrate-binding protein, CUT1 family [Arthrobacter alpinus]|uniref:Carbohydrate ABC transporter substrate-binding protein, CUT1 family n=1 Tax=Arthrobacter alpinus TaxID=656366 RepID=A0A1H5F2Q7_9MICC|nr:extracellular solute-binding protein [Arthrobacter alpinus]SED97564.1 carbohydrate ABC transporter substrate-binding protein, CUT1 family [Arthrobacter alpinus]